MSISVIKPLRVGGSRESVGAQGVNDRFIRNASGVVIACASEGTMQEAREIARTIVESVNTPAAIVIAYVAIGANAAMLDLIGNGNESFEGEMGFYDALLSHVPLMDRVACAFDEDGHPGVFLYDVAEPFGHKLAKAMQAEGDISQRQVADILAGVMIAADYDAAAVAAAIARELGS